MSETGEGRSSKLDDILKARRRRMMRNLASLALAISLLGYLFWRQTRESSTPTPPPTEAPILAQQPVPLSEEPAPRLIEPRPETRVPEQETAAPAVEPLTRTKPAAPALPDLDASDPWLRAEASPLSTHAEIGAWLSGSDLIRRFVVSVANVSEGRSPRKHLQDYAPPKRFSVRTEEEERLFVDEQSYARYDIAAQLFDSIDEAYAAFLYSKVEPLFDRAYQDLGYPDGHFREPLQLAIQELLSAPIVTGDVEVARRVVTFEFLDPELEYLSAAQKQLIRMGPTNVALVQRKLRRVALALGIPADALPQSTVHQATTPAGMAPAD